MKPCLRGLRLEVFERDYDIGAYRDLQRQRGDLQQCTPYGVIGFSMPEEIAQIGLEGEFLKLMAGVKQVHCKFMDAGLEYISEYIPLMANHVRHVVTEDPVQAFYVAKLRAQPAGAPSYRRIAQEETKIVLEKMPAFNGLVKYDTNHYELGRLEEYVQHEMRKTE
jgi:hypothetical protein